eukprot:scaffold1941_cov72-Skeletonema_dohrnii-CCMP3373.AAC.3
MGGQVDHVHRKKAGMEDADYIYKTPQTPVSPPSPPSHLLNQVRLGFALLLTEKKEESGRRKSEAVRRDRTDDDVSCQLDCESLDADGAATGPGAGRPRLSVDVT